MEITHYSQIFKKQVNKYGNRIALRYKDNGTWKETSWKSFGEQVDALSKALVQLGVKVHDCVGIFSQNRPEWTIVDFAAIGIRAVPVPLYPTSTARQAEYIINDARIRILFVDDRAQYEKALILLGTNPFLKNVIVFNGNLPIAGNDAVCCFTDLLKKGRQSNLDAEVAARLNQAQKEDLLTLVYTSGTTGEPKGVMLTHANILFQAEQHDQRLLNPNDSDISLCFLPLSHVFERIWTYYVFSKGMTNVYLDDPSKIIEFIPEVKPTIMCAVPRFYEKIYAAVYNRLESASPMKKTLFHWAIKMGRAFHNRRKDKLAISTLLALKYKIADKLVLKKIRDLTGGRVRFFPCAGAPLSQEIEEFFYAVGMFVCYGYGLSETTATVTCHEPHFFNFGAVGKPLPGVEVIIDPINSEVLIRGGNIMKGYYNKPEETARVLTEDGFFRTGDAGEFDDNGELRITDRIKDLIKTSGGKYIAPQMLETLVCADFYIEQISIIGERKKYVTALIIPSFPALEEYAEAKGIKFTFREDLIKSPKILNFYKQRIEGLTKDIAPFEKIKKFTLLAREFTMDSDEITPTMKVRRNIIHENYKDIIEAMYD